MNFKIWKTFFLLNTELYQIICFGDLWDLEWTI